MTHTHTLRTGSVSLAGVLLLLLVLLLTGCPEPPPEEPSWMDTPKGFVEIPARDFVHKAVSPDGSVIGVRYRANEEEGDLAFWSEVFELEMVEAKGYRLVEQKSVKSGDGIEGTHMQLEYAHEGEIPYHYGLSIYVTEKSIVTVETATELESQERYADAFTAARSGVQVKTAETDE